MKYSREWKQLKFGKCASLTFWCVCGVFGYHVSWNCSDTWYFFGSDILDLHSPSQFPFTSIKFLSVNIANTSCVMIFWFHSAGWINKMKITSVTFVKSLSEVVPTSMNEKMRFFNVLCKKNWSLLWYWKLNNF